MSIQYGPGLVAALYPEVPEVLVAPKAPKVLVATKALVGGEMTVVPAYPCIGCLFCDSTDCTEQVTSWRGFGMNREQCQSCFDKDNERR